MVSDYTMNSKQKSLKTFKENIVACKSYKWTGRTGVCREDGREVTGQGVGTVLTPPHPRKEVWGQLKRRTGHSHWWDACSGSERVPAVPASNENLTVRKKNSLTILTFYYSGGEA